MKATLICPDRRPEVAFLARKTPLALVSLLGPSLLAHWLTELADRGIKEVTILASDRPDQVRIAVGGGERWGLNIEVRAEPREMTAAEARARFGTETVVLADRLPGLPEAPLFEGYAGFFSALESWLPQAHKPRVGAREVAPGVWAGLRCKIDARVTLTAPCWLGQDVWVRGGGRIGPGAFIEDSVLVDHDAEVIRSWVGPRTYVGALTHLNQSLAWADGLLNHANGSFTEVADAFLLGDLRGNQGFARSSPWYGRLAALGALVTTSPLVLMAALKNAGADQPLMARKRAVIPTGVATKPPLRELIYSELNGLSGLGRRWPQLWSIVRGEFTWVGNRPLTGEQVKKLETEFEQLWLAAPIGLISLADAYGCGDRFDDEARAHSSFYAVQTDGRLDRAVLKWLCLGSAPKTEHKPKKQTT